MSYSIVVSESADLHIKESVRWYEAQREGLGSLFLLSIKDCLRILINNPFTCAIVYLDLRRILTKKFQHALFFYINEVKKHVIIIAVLHTSQNPEIWKQLAK